MKAASNGAGSAHKRLAAVCGLFCPACTIFIGSTDDPGRLKVLADRLGVSAEDLECHGCRSEKRAMYCNNYCKMTRCAQEKGLDFCGQCSEYPCAELKAFQGQMPHRLELWQSQDRIRAAGYEAWYAEMLHHYSCPTCGTINSAYDQVCRACGTTPSCEYVRLHGEEVAKRRTRLSP